MRYNDAFIANSQATFANYVINANGPYAPISGGHQPRGWDQWQQFYDHYICHSSKCWIKISTIVPSEQPVVVAVTLSDDPSLITTNGINSVLEGGKAKWTTIANSTAAGADNQKSFAIEWSGKRWYGVADLVDNIDWLGASVSANPADLAHFVLCIGNPQNTVFANPYLLQVEFMLEYLVSYHEPKDLPTS